MRNTILTAAVVALLAGTPGVADAAKPRYTSVRVGYRVNIVLPNGESQKVNCGQVPEGKIEFIPQQRGGRWNVDSRFYGISLAEDGCILVNPNW